MVQLSEEEIITAAQKDPRDFVHLYDRYVDRVFGYVYRMTGDEDSAKDVTSATFENALKNIQKYRYRGVDFIAWLYRIARNEVFQHERRRKFQAILNPSMKSDVDVENQVLANIQQKLVRKALKSLPEKDRDLVVLRFLEGLSSAQVAEVLNCSPQTYYVRLHRALVRLRSVYEVLESTDGNISSQANSHNKHPDKERM